MGRNVSLKLSQFFIISLLLVLTQAFNKDDFTQEAYHIENPAEVRDSIDDEHT